MRAISGFMRERTMIPAALGLAAPLVGARGTGR